MTLAAQEVDQSVRRLEYIQIVTAARWTPQARDGVLQAAATGRTVATVALPSIGLASGPWHGITRAGARGDPCSSANQLREIGRRVWC
jgi:aryl-alcohol dehydrogenase-like predicted oxidoreductase